MATKVSELAAALTQIRNLLAQGFLALDTLDIPKDAEDALQALTESAQALAGKKGVHII